ncbi:MAG: energy-coupling factor transporter ATPase [Treponema sp.]|nr:energy-coupling factor transporter ATPase [Treponema sp.]
MITFENLSFSYGDTNNLVLKNINLQINDGDFLGIIGSSGAGKTTLSYAINGIIPHHYKGEYYGKVMVDGDDVFDTEPCQLSMKIGSVFQDIDSQMTCATVEDEILFGMENFGLSKEDTIDRLEWVLKEMGIESLRDREISGLSGGQKQKVAIAAILALRPKILVLDEPTGELDPTASRNIFRIVKELNKKFGLTVIVIEQKIRLLCEFADHLAFIEKGELKFHGTVKEVLSHRNELADLGLNHDRVGKILDALADGKVLADIYAEELTRKGSFDSAQNDSVHANESILTLEKVSFGYDLNYLIENTNFTVYKGDFLALTGENGSGKSTLSKLMGGILKPENGTVMVNGLDTKKTRNSVIAKHIGFLFQNPDRQLCCYTIRDEIAFGLKALKLPDIETRTDEILARFNFDPEKAPFALSRGQRQQLALASIIAVHPEIMILDEPTTGLDYKECIELMNAIRELNQQGTTVIMVCHDMEIVRDYAKRMVIVGHGAILADGNPEELVPILESNSLKNVQYDTAENGGAK